MDLFVKFTQTENKHKEKIKRDFVKSEKENREESRQSYRILYDQLRESWDLYQKQFEDSPQKLRQLGARQDKYFRGGHLFEFDSLFPESCPTPDEISKQITNSEQQTVFWKAFDEMTFGFIDYHKKDLMDKAEKIGIDPGDVSVKINDRAHKHNIALEEKVNIQINENKGNVNNYDTEPNKSE